MINRVNIVTVTLLEGRPPSESGADRRWKVGGGGALVVTTFLLLMDGRPRQKCTSFLVKIPDGICRRLTARQSASQRSGDMSHFRTLAVSSFSNLLPLALGKKKKRGNERLEGISAGVAIYKY